MIKSCCLNHGQNYTYRYHRGKLANLASNGFSNLQQYLFEVGESCPENIFLSGPRSSSLHFDLNVSLEEIKGHKMSKIAEHALKNYLGTPHDKVQLCALENEPSVVAMEVPLWIKPTDLMGVDLPNELLSKMFLDGEILTGHIDLLAIENGNIWIWDFKPNAHKEKYAKMQVMLYALMLSKRTRINLDKFRCGYFDEKRAYLFKPTMESIGGM